ncbi:hypothetical protein Q5425_10605 [Amycolatopsis sp. A133]|uniref:hypothetical protein n=1 Tax=Amycolatopsis sp. A133 TaxID=3064472 RepID=UPI0027F3E9B5|nr:hypothetical protein [Amycolatopsis sp. A133]MDQ7804185.1 hypothetical protein [Amycolatopsis sp. A133]
MKTRGRVLAWAGLINSAIVVASVLLPGAAEAKPLLSGEYPVYAYEGQYPTSTPCAGGFGVHATKTFNWFGRIGTLRMYYHPSCGVYARVDNVESYCYVQSHRNSGEFGPYGWVTETTDGLNYAYTMMTNNLNGRLSDAVAICSGTEVARITWF